MRSMLCTTPMELVDIVDDDDNVIAHCQPGRDAAAQPAAPLRRHRRVRHRRPAAGPSPQRRQGHVARSVGHRRRRSRRRRRGRTTTRRAASSARSSVSTVTSSCEHLGGGATPTTTWRRSCRVLRDRARRAVPLRRRRGRRGALGDLRRARRRCWPRRRSCPTASPCCCRCSTWPELPSRAAPTVDSAGDGVPSVGVRSTKEHHMSMYGANPEQLSRLGQSMKQPDRRRSTG